MSAIDRLTDEFSRLPGIGSKTALRLVHHLMKGTKDETKRLAGALVDLADKVRACDVCGNFSEHEKCEICVSTRRDVTLLCVVEEAYEVSAIERTGQFRGLFHVLGGRLSPLDGIGPDELNVESLIRRIHDSEGGIREVGTSEGGISEGGIIEVGIN